VVKTNTVKGLEIKPGAVASVTVADLEVSETKVIGVAKGLLLPPIVTKETLTQGAITDAVMKHEGADVLVGITIFTELNKRDMTVTVTGYPARYKNFRAYEPWTEQKADKLIVKVNKREGKKFGGPQGRDHAGPRDRADRPDAPATSQAPAAAPATNRAPATAPAINHAPAAAPSEE
jgi:hypothetical protein